MFLVQGKIYIIGGVGGGGTRYTGSNTGSPSGISQPAPSLQPGAVEGFLKGTASAVTATDSFSHVNSVFAYDVAAAEWSIASTSGSPPPPRSNLAAVAVGHCIVVHGGQGPQPSALGASSASNTATPQGRSVSVAGHGPSGGTDQGAHSLVSAMDEGRPPVELFSDLHVLDTRSMRWTTAQPNAVIADFSEELLTSSVAAGAPDSPPAGGRARQADALLEQPEDSLFASLLSNGREDDQLQARLSPSQRAQTAADMRDRHRLVQLVAALAAPVFVAGTMNALRQHFGAAAPSAFTSSQTDVRDLLDKMVKSREVATAASRRPAVVAPPRVSGRRGAGAAVDGHRASPRGTIDGRSEATSAVSGGLGHDHPYRHTPLKRVRGALLLLPDLIVDAAMQAAPVPTPRTATAQDNGAASFAQVDIGVPVPSTVVHAVAGDSSLMMQLCNQLSSALSPLAAVPEPRHSHSLCTWATDGGAAPALVMFGGMTRTAALASATFTAGVSSSNKRRTMEVPSTDVFLFDVNAGVWIKLPIEGPSCPAARGYHAATVVGDKMYVYGGLGADGVLGDMWELDLSPLAQLTSIAGSVVQARVNDVAEHVMGMHGLSSQRTSVAAQRRSGSDKLGSMRTMNANISHKLPACHWRCLANAPGPAELAMHARHKRVNALRAGRDEDAEAAAVAADMEAALAKGGVVGQHSVVSSAATVAWQANWGPGAVFGHRMVSDPWDQHALLVSGGRSWFGAPTSGVAGAARSTALGAMQVWKFNVQLGTWEAVSAPGENRTVSPADLSGSVVGAVLQAQAFHERGGTEAKAGETESSGGSAGMSAIEEEPEGGGKSMEDGGSDENKEGEGKAESHDGPKQAGISEHKEELDEHVGGSEAAAQRIQSDGDTSQHSAGAGGKHLPAAPKQQRTHTPGGFSIADSTASATGAPTAAAFRASSSDTADLPPPLFRFCMLSLWLTGSEEGIFKHWAQHRSVVFGARAAVGMRITSLASVSVAPLATPSRSLVSALGRRAATGGTPKARGSAVAHSAGEAFDAFSDVVDAVAVPASVSKAGAERAQARKRALHALLPALAPLVMAAHKRSDAWSNAEDTEWVNGVLAQMAASLDSQAWWFSGHGFRVELVSKGWFRVPPPGYAGPFSLQGDLGKRVRVVPLRHLGGRGLALAAAHEIAQRQVFTAGGTRQGHLSAVGMRDAATAGGQRRISTAGAARAVMASLSARSLGAAAAADRAAGRPSAKEVDEQKAGEDSSSPTLRAQLAVEISAASLLDNAQAQDSAWVASTGDFDVSTAEARSVPGGTLRRLFDPSPEERIQLMTEALYRRVVVFGGICVPPAPLGGGSDGGAVDTARSRSMPSRSDMPPGREASSSMGAGASLYELGSALEGALAQREDEAYDDWFDRVNNDARLSEIWRHRQAVAEQRRALRKRGRAIPGEPVSASTALHLGDLAARGRLHAAGFMPLIDVFQLCLAPPDLCAQPDHSGAEDASDALPHNTRHMTVQFDRTATDYSEGLHMAGTTSPGAVTHSTMSHRDGDGPSVLLVARSRRTHDITDVRKPGQLVSLVPPDPNAFKPHEAPPKQAAHSSPEQLGSNGGVSQAARKRLPNASLPDTATNKTLVQVLVNEVEGGAGNTRTTGRGTEFPSSEPLLMPSATTNTLAKLMSRDARADAATAAHVDSILPRQMQRKFPTGLKLDGPVPEETLLAAAKVAQRAERGASREALAALLGVRTAAVMDPRVNSAAPVLAAEAAMVGPLITFDAREIALRSQADRPAQQHLSMSMSNLGSGAPGVEASKVLGEPLVPIFDDGEGEQYAGQVRMQQQQQRAAGPAGDRRSPNGLVSPMRVPAGFVVASGRTGTDAGTAASGTKQSFVRVPSRKASRARVPGSPGFAADSAIGSSDAGLGGTGHFPVGPMQGDATDGATPREDASDENDLLRGAPVYTIRAGYDDDEEDHILPPASTFLANVASGVVSAVDVVPGWQKPQKAADIVESKQRAESRASSRHGRRFQTSADTQEVDFAPPPAAARPLAVSPPDKHRLKPSRVLHPALVHSMKASVQREQTREHIRSVLGQRETGSDSTSALARSALGAGNTASMSSIVSGAPGVTRDVTNLGGVVTETIELNPGGMHRPHPKADGDVDGGASAAVSPRFTMAGASALMHVDKYAGDMHAFGGKPKEGTANSGVPVSHRPAAKAVPEGQQSDVNAAARRGIGGTIPFSQPPRERASVGDTGLDSGRLGPQRWVSAAEVVVARRSKRTNPSVAAAASAAAGDGIVDSHATVIGEGHRAGRNAQGRVAGDLRGFVTPRSAAGNEMLRKGSASGVGRSLRARGTGAHGKSLLHVHKQAEKLLHQHAHAARKRETLNASSDGVMNDLTASELSKYGMITLQDQMNSRMVPSSDKRGKAASSQRQATEEAIQLALSSTKEFATVKRGGAPTATINADSQAARAVQLAKALAGGDTGAGLRGAADDDSDSDDEPLGKHWAAPAASTSGGPAPHAPTAALGSSTSAVAMGAAGSIAPGFASTLSTRGRTTTGLGKSSSTRLTTTAPLRAWGAATPASAPHSDLTGHKLQVHGVTRPAQLKALSLSQRARKKRTAGDPNQAIVAGSSSASSAFVQKQPILSAFDRATPKPNLTALRRQMQAEFAEQQER